MCSAQLSLHAPPARPLMVVYAHRRMLLLSSSSRTSYPWQRIAGPVRAKKALARGLIRWGGAPEDRARALFSVHQQHLRYFSFLHQHQTGSASRLGRLHAQARNILEAAVLKNNHKASVRPVHQQHSHKAAEAEIEEFTACCGASPQQW